VTGSTLVVYGEELGRLRAVLHDLWRDSNARAVFVIDRNGMELSSAGETEQFDATSLASLAAGNVAATDGLAKLIGEREFSVLFHEGHEDHLHISVVAQRYILLVIFDRRSSLGLVRLRVKQVSPRIKDVFSAVSSRAQLDQLSEPVVSLPRSPGDRSAPALPAAGPFPSPAEPPRSGGRSGLANASPFSQITDEDIEALFSD
jgi:predicted regulator of Ras-like GTPase activity (Roadblock/LC7/MglB family)